jgi:hypothetical protein
VDFARGRGRRLRHHWDCGKGHQAKPKWKKPLHVFLLVSGTGEAPAGSEIILQTKPAHSRWKERGVREVVPGKR